MKMNYKKLCSYLDQISITTCKKCINRINMLSQFLEEQLRKQVNQIKITVILHQMLIIFHHNTLFQDLSLNQILNPTIKKMKVVNQL